MSVHTYPLTAVIGDYTRTVLGIAICIVPFYVAPEKPIVSYVSIGLIAAFAVYGLRTLARQLTRIEIGEAGIRANMPTPRAIAWDDIERVRLRFFAPRRKRLGNGWFQLVLSGGGRHIALESSIRGFDAVVSQAAAVAARNGLTLDEATASNLQALTPTSAPTAP